MTCPILSLFPTKGTDTQQQNRGESTTGPKLPFPPLKKGLWWEE